MKYSNFFIPTFRENPSDAKLKSHVLMIKSGMIKQETSGIYSWLPLGFKVLKKIITIIEDMHESHGINQILMPTIQASDIWKISDRYDTYGKEMLRIVDRNNKELLYGPTNEEMITAIGKHFIKSHKNLPCYFFHVQSKFRDEIRPRFGVMRCKEFFMKDAYSFDLTDDAARKSYNKMFFSYLKTFNRLGLKAIPMAADTGPIGGDLSHEFIILAETGESQIFADKRIFEINLDKYNFSDASLSKMRKDFTDIYAATDEKFDEKKFNKEVDKKNQIKTKGIEVGHIFYFGDKYSKPMEASVDLSEGKKDFVKMGSYGIGVSRLVGAIIEYSHDDKGIIWPENVAPFSVGILNLKKGDEYCDKMSELVYQNLLIAGLEVLYDDTSERAGSKFANMDLIGLPYQVFIGSKSKDNGLFEIKERATNKRYFLKLESLINHLTEKFN